MRRPLVSSAVVLALTLAVGAPASAQVPPNLLQLLQQLQVQFQPQVQFGCKREINLTPVGPPVGAATLGFFGEGEKRHDITRQKFEVEILAKPLTPYLVLVTTSDNPTLQTVGGIFTNFFGLGEFELDNRQPNRGVFFTNEVCNVRQILVVTLTQQPVFFGDFNDPFNFDNIEFEIEIRRGQIEIEVELELNNIFNN